MPFGAFARRRVLGAMLDELRARDTLGRISRQQVRDGLRRHVEVHFIEDAKDFTTGDGDWSVTFCGVPDTAPSPEALVIQDQDREALRRALRALHPRDARILRARFWKQQTQAEIGRAEGVSQKRISQIEQRALARLRAILAAG